MGRDVMEAEAAVVGMRPAEGTRAAVGLGTEVPGARLLLIDDYEFIRIGAHHVRAAARPTGRVARGGLAAGRHRDLRPRRALRCGAAGFNLSDCKGLAGLRLFMQAHPLARVLIFSGTVDEFVIRQARALGAQGYLRKTGSACRSCSPRWPSCCRRLSVRACRWPPSGSFPPAGIVDVRPHRRAGAAASGGAGAGAVGLHQPEISSATTLSLGTVKNYVSSLLLALDVRSRLHLISLFR